MESHALSLFVDEEGPWTWPQDPESHFRDCWEEEVTDAIATVLGDPTSCSLTVDIISRRSGYDEALGLARDLLTRWEGIVGDDYSEHMWRLDELGQRNAEGRLFFRDMDTASG